MPLLLDRRGFFRDAIGGIAGAALAARSLRADTKSEIHWALLSDVHIAADKGDVFRGFHPHENLRRVFSSIWSANSFESVLINGDLARMQGAKRTVAAEMPTADVEG